MDTTTSLIPTEPVDTWRPANAAEEVLAYGDDLTDGMVVLIAEPGRRAQPEPPFSGRNPALVEVARKRTEHDVAVLNRWCQVTRLRSASGAFVGRYADGSEHPRQFHRHVMWLVRRDSIPAGHHLRTHV